MTKEYALSIKQPWAALILHGVKTVEVRRWPTTRRGPILLHASRLPDEREYAWAQVPESALAATELRGGIIGRVELLGCLNYTCAEDFQADRTRHLNDPAWFVPPVMYGFQLANPSPLPFRQYAGNVRFFTVPPQEPQYGSTS